MISYLSTYDESSILSIDGPFTESPDGASYLVVTFQSGDTEDIWYPTREAAYEDYTNYLLEKHAR